MCGACGGPPPDPAGALVAGPRRRAAVARAVGAACPGVVVRVVPGGWTVATRTGRTTVCRTVDALVTALAPHTRPSGGPLAGRQDEVAAADVVLGALRRRSPPTTQPG